MKYAFSVLCGFVLPCDEMCCSVVHCGVLQCVAVYIYTESLDEVCTLTAVWRCVAV